jgi:hypothetical protein
MPGNSTSKNTAANEAVHAEATTTIRKYGHTVYDKPQNGLALSKVHLEEGFSGDIQGDGVVECVQGESGHVILDYWFE